GDPQCRHAAKFVKPRDPVVLQLTGGRAQWSFRHLKPALAPQQSASTVHFSNSCEQPCGLSVQTSPPPSSGERQKPVQHSAPPSHELPLLLHGSTTQWPRMFPALSSCPGR